MAAAWAADRTLRAIMASQQVARVVTSAAPSKKSKPTIAGMLAGDEVSGLNNEKSFARKRAK